MTTRALDRIVNLDGDADDVLRVVVETLVEEPEIDWAGISFLDSGELVLGPQAGREDEARRVRTPIAYQGDDVGVLAVDGEAEQRFLDRIAAAISAYVLLAWDTCGEAWEP